MGKGAGGSVADGAVHLNKYQGGAIEGIAKDPNRSVTPEYVSYSGVDMKAVIHIPPETMDADKVDKGEAATFDTSKYHSKPIILADIQTLSYSIYREKYPVRALGYGYPKSFTRGSRTISGSMIFTLFDKQVLHDFIDRIKPDTPNDFSTVLIDQLPRFDVTMTFSNEYGSASVMVIHGVEIISEGATMSIEDLITENVVEYIAQDITPMRREGETMKKIGFPKQKTGSDIARERAAIKRQTGMSYSGTGIWYE